MRSKSKATPRHSNRWSKDLAADLEAIASELDLPSSCVKALQAAAAKKLISCNPGVLICQVGYLAP
jgi:hypothetical protein